MDVLQTARLELRPCRNADLRPIHRLWSDPEVCRFLFDGRRVSLAEAGSFVAESLKSFGVRGYGLWLMSPKSSDDLIGFTGLLCSRPGPPNLVYGLRSESWGRGYATEAASAVLRYSFAALKLRRIVADVDQPNLASVRVLEKLGMSRVGSDSVDGRPLLYFAIDGH